MIESIKFTGEDKNDYLLKRRTKRVLRKNKTIEQFQEEIKYSQRTKTEVEDKYFKIVNDGLANGRANKCLIGREIKFEKDKINIIFGPNASGKTTILKTIASYCLCGSSSQFDGFTSIEKFRPTDYPWSFEKPRNYDEDGILKLIVKQAGNHADIKWDGSPVFYQNFTNRRMSTIDDYDGTIFGNVAEALSFDLGKQKTSDGKSSLLLFSKLYDLVEKRYSFDDITKEFEYKVKSVNDTWAECYRNNYEYLKKFQNNKNDHITILLDEIDKSLDINNISYIFKELIPELHNINHDQIIVISHSPLVCSEDICSPEKYNFISMDDKYTSNVKELFRNIKF